MGHDLLFHALLLLGVLGFCAILRWVWPPRRAAMDQADGQPATRTYRRSAAPPPLPGLTTTPLWATCEQAAQAHGAQASAGPPPLRTATPGRRRQVATQHQCCPPPWCRYEGGGGRGHRRATGHPGGGPWRQWSCVACGADWLDTQGTPLPRQRAPAARLVRVVAAVAAGLGLRAVARVCAVAPHTVLAWLVEAADPRQAVSSSVLPDVQARQVQLDERVARLRAVKGGKLRDAAALERFARAPHGVWGAIAPVSKRRLALDVGARTLGMAQRLVHPVVERWAPAGLPWFRTDGLQESAMALLTPYGPWGPPFRQQATGPAPKPRGMPRPPWRYAQVVKSYVTASR
jgi:hypothetical protein